MYRLHDIRKDCEDKMVVYKSIVKRANEFKTHHYCPSMTDLLTRLEEHEDDRISAFKAAADKIIVYETNLELNNRYDAKAFA